MLRNDSEGDPKLEDFEGGEGGVVSLGTDYGSSN